jgi:hypothetical protein
MKKITIILLFTLAGAAYGQPVSSGVYFAVLAQRENVAVKKMLLLK